MKLKPEYIRQIMLVLEEKLTINSDLYSEEINVSQLSELLPKIPREEIFYTLCKLDEAGLIAFSVQYSSNLPVYNYVSSITYNGHVFLDTIRDNSIWSKTLKALASIGATAPALIKDIATMYLSSRLGL